MTVSSEEIKTQCSELTRSAPDVNAWRNPNNIYDLSRWIRLSKAMPHDMRRTPFTATMFVGVIVGNPMVRVTASRPSKKGQEIAFFDIMLPSEKHQNTEIQFCFPSVREAQEHFGFLTNPSMPLMHLKQHLKVRSLSHSTETRSDRKPSRAEEKAAKWLNAVIDTLIPEGWDSSITYELFQQLLGLEPEEAAKIIEDIKRSQVPVKGKQEVFFDPDLATAHV